MAHLIFSSNRSVNDMFLFVVFVIVSWITTNDHFI
jgi:hypothetical protein